MNVKKLIFEGEGVTLDFKKTITSCEKIARTMVAFANNKGGMEIITRYQSPEKEENEQ